MSLRVVSDNGRSEMPYTPDPVITTELDITTPGRFLIRAWRSDEIMQTPPRLRPEYLHDTTEGYHLTIERIEP